MWQSFVELIHHLIPWFNGGLADVIIIVITFSIDLSFNYCDGVYDLCRKKSDWFYAAKNWA